VFTDPVPRAAALREEFVRSDQLKDLLVPEGDRLRLLARRIETAMERDARGDLKAACSDFLVAAAEFYKVRPPGVSVLAARPLRVREGGWTSELFGDYAPNNVFIRVWMRTAVLKKVTSFGTFFSTLCHEFCHHLDCQRFGFTRSPHTRGFYARAGILYHHARATPMRDLVWRKMPGNRWRIDWQAMKRTPQPDVRIAHSPTRHPAP
jgi:hypothetical protein